MATQWPPGASLRLATIGHGMAFGEMAFLNGQPRTACAGAEGRPARLLLLDRPAFDQWAAAHPRDALVLMNNLALMGTRRLAATTRQLRAVLESGPTASPAVPG
jgi:CRP-like cAMP-binding protein